MNVKIKATDVFCLVENYDEVYEALRKQLSEDDFIFSERKPGAGFLQWELPGDGWVSLSDADPIVKSEVIAEKELRFGNILALFGGNRQFAQMVLTVPSDDYIFYKASSQGRVIIRIAAWAYKNPEKVVPSPPVVPINQKDEFQEVEISFENDGHRVSGYEFKIDGFNRKTNETGILPLGLLPVGKVYTVETLNGKTVSMEVVPGQRDFVVDITEYSTVKIEVRQEGLPCADVVCKVSYNGRELSLTTNKDGYVETLLPLGFHGGECIVSVDGARQQKPLIIPVTLFEFLLEKPEEPETEDENPVDDNSDDIPTPEIIKPEEEVKHDEPDIENEEDKEDEVKEETESRYFAPIIKIEGSDGFIGRSYPIIVTIGGVSREYVSDKDGIVYLPEVEEGQEMVIADMLLGDNEQRYMLDADQDVYIFRIPYKPSNTVNDITVIAQDENGRPMSGATAFFAQQGSPNTLAYLNEKGETFLSRRDYGSNRPLSVTLTVGHEKYAPIEFELEEDEDVYLLKAVGKTSLMSRILEILMAILGFIGTFAVFMLINKMLF